MLWFQVRELLDLGADPNDRDVNSRQTLSALHWASWKGRVTVVRELLAHGADHASVNKWGKTPLHWAAIVGSVECGTVLFRQGNCDLDARNKQGRTACHLASADGRPEFVSWLIESGADITLLDGAGHTAYDLGKFCLI